MSRVFTPAPRFPLPARRPHGFTLIEVLVVLILIGITVGLATLSVGSAGGRQAEQEANRLTALINLASDEAVLKSEEVGIRFRPDGYEFYILAADNTWKPAEDDVLRVRTLPPGFVLLASAGGMPIRFEKEKPKDKDQPPAPHGFFLSSGERTTFEVELGPAGGVHYRVQVPVIGDLTVTSLDAPVVRR